MCDDALYVGLRIGRGDAVPVLSRYTLACARAFRIIQTNAHGRPARGGASEDPRVNPCWTDGGQASSEVRVIDIFRRAGLRGCSDQAPDFGIGVYRGSGFGLAGRVTCR